MAPFNKRQIGYIQAIAGRQQHRTLISGQKDQLIKCDDALAVTYKPQTLLANHIYGKYGSPQSTGTNDTPSAETAKSLLLHTWNLDVSELAFDSRSKHNDSRLEADDYTSLYNTDTGGGDNTSLQVFNAPVKGSYASGDTSTTIAEGQLQKNDDFISSIHRATTDGFLNSTDLKVRFTLPRVIQAGAQDSNNPMGQDHYEFRWIVWRHKKPQFHDASETHDRSNLEFIRDGASFRNPGYDFFMGQTGRKRGFLGYTLNADLDKDKVQNAPNGEVYCGYRFDGSGIVNSGNLLDGSFDGHSPKTGIPDKEQGFTVDDLLTSRINRDDYVVMKDVRFFLGKEHGKSHFEDHLHWDWNDPIDTPLDNVLSSPTLNNKNYRWHMTLLGTSGGKSHVEINTGIRWTTKMESG